MTHSEFKAWLEGYMLDRKDPDAKVIAKKAQEVHADQLPYVPQPYPVYVNPPVFQPRFAPWPNTIYCGGASPIGAMAASSTIN